MLHPAGRGGVRPVRPGHQADPRARAAARTGRRHSPVAAGPGRRRFRGGARFAGHLLGTLVLLGIASRLNQVSSNIAGTHGPVAARSEGTASALLTATRQTGPALGVAILSAVLVIVHGRSNYRAEVAMFIAAGFALVGLLATRVVPPGPPHPHAPPPQHLFRHHAGGIP